MSESELEVQPAAEAAPGLTQWQRVINTFTAPSKTFEDIKRGNKSWWLPLIIMALAGYLFFAVVSQKITMGTVVDNQVHLSSSAQERLAQLTPEQREKNHQISIYFTEGVFLGGPVIGLIAVAIISLVLLGTINFVFGGRAKYGSIFAVYYYAYLPSLVKVLLGIVVIYAGIAPESFNIKNFAPTNIGAFLDPVDTNKALYALATSLDAVTIWMLILISIGVATVAGVKRSSGYIAVFGWWAIVVLFGMAAAAIFG
ncbi:MAG TPA: YIP1 family protein [Terracidiphilus sp.]|nr:YIP1 family protein [Terracidiphilus sp.]